MPGRTFYTTLRAKNSIFLLKEKYIKACVLCDDNNSILDVEKSRTLWESKKAQLVSVSILRKVCHLDPLYYWDGRRLHSRYLQTRHCTPKQSRWINSTTDKRKIWILFSGWAVSFKLFFWIDFLSLPVYNEIAARSLISLAVMDLNHLSALWFPLLLLSLANLK